jgi:hypothetical protein
MLSLQCITSLEGTMALHRAHQPPMAGSDDRLSPIHSAAVIGMLSAFGWGGIILAAIKLWAML